MKKRPTDPFQLAKMIGDIATGQVEDKDDARKSRSKKKRKKVAKKDSSVIQK